MVESGNYCYFLYNQTTRYITNPRTFYRRNQPELGCPISVYLGSVRYPWSAISDWPWYQTSDIWLKRAESDIISDIEINFYLISGIPILSGNHRCCVVTRSCSESWGVRSFLARMKTEKDSPTTSPLIETSPMTSHPMTSHPMDSSPHESWPQGQSPHGRARPIFSLPHGQLAQWLWLVAWWKQILHYTYEPSIFVKCVCCKCLKL